MNEREEKEGGREKRRRKQREEEERIEGEEAAFVARTNEGRPTSDLSINLRPDGRTRVITCKRQRESCESRESLLST